MNASDDVADRIAAGRAVYARNLGVPEDEAERMLAGRAGAQYAREAFLAAGGPGWSGTGLTDRDRSVAVVAALVGQHVVDARLATYLNAARAAGVTEEGLGELMVLLTAYLGQPAASAAMATVLGTAPRPAAVATD
ncbi:carboxymuconolactone decarboxylase family protein [Micromonospora sp. WMMD712]|uniref:carboxymuconolactone decarboxylase family protein n=1 Tax=Micromonospora sp. WMMD712 TaxID=3016096 RepID=UPI00249A1F7A|nr:carboxymuconolactone decarboxylase family protein [Micromonospora sp. WMMD712]WFE56855.1 carboxymuconolactone decarboxylase family protein [Micromonospora sp. WMMD712]